MHAWTFHAAKNYLSEVVRRALAHEPQLVTLNSRDAVVVVSAEEYRRLLQPHGLIEFLQDSPMAEALAAGELDLRRPRDGAP